jgi:hypothetical protein
MRTIETKIYQFNELSEKSKEVAIEDFRENKYGDSYILDWIVDDCYLLEPKHDDLVASLGSLYKDLIIENNRKVYFSLDRDRHIDISNAMVIKDDYLFLKWLGLPDELIDEVSYTIGRDTIYFEKYPFEEYPNQDIIDNAVEKFESHCEDILRRIESSYEYQFSDEYIIDEIISNEYEFLDNGKIF